MKDDEEIKAYQTGYQLTLNPSDSWLCICGRKEKLSGYVAAHWDMSLKYTCPECKAKYSLLSGVLELYDTSEQAIR